MDKNSLILIKEEKKEKFVLELKKYDTNRHANIGGGERL